MENFEAKFYPNMEKPKETEKKETGTSLAKETRFFKDPFSERDEGTAVKLERGAKLGEGAFGSVFEATIELSKRKKKFVIKEFKDGDLSQSPKDTAENRAREAIEHWRVAKKAGLKVFPTYRIGDDEKSILMTSAHGEKNICVDPFPVDGATVETFGRSKLQEISNLDQLFEGLLKECRKATDHQIDIFPDAYFFLVDRKTDMVDFVLGDTDYLVTSPGVHPKDHATSNLGRAKIVLESFIEKNVSGPKQKEYLKYLEDKVGGLIGEIEKEKVEKYKN
ncbi:hypothetical protein KKA27_03765 [Patescibacteria group bacterium]|nr:hypothetical protein [Patescibacteria group bacterium]MBU2632936.1 hypothetical protein [Patescibacteria group bacterium]